MRNVFWYAGCALCLARSWQSIGLPLPPCRFVCFGRCYDSYAHSLPLLAPLDCFTCREAVAPPDLSQHGPRLRKGAGGRGLPVPAWFAWGAVPCIGAWLLRAYRSRSASAAGRRCMVKQPVWPSHCRSTTRQRSARRSLEPSLRRSRRTSKRSHCSGGCTRRHCCVRAQLVCACKGVAQDALAAQLCTCAASVVRPACVCSSAQGQLPRLQSHARAHRLLALSQLPRPVAAATSFALLALRCTHSLPLQPRGAGEVPAAAERVLPVHVSLAATWPLGCTAQWVVAGLLGAVRPAAAECALLWELGSSRRTGWAVVPGQGGRLLTRAACHAGSSIS